MPSILWMLFMDPKGGEFPENQKNFRGFNFFPSRFSSGFLPSSPPADGTHLFLILLTCDLWIQDMLGASYEISHRWYSADGFRYSTINTLSLSQKTKSHALFQGCHWLIFSSIVYRRANILQAWEEPVVFILWGKKANWFIELFVWKFYPRADAIFPFSEFGCSSFAKKKTVGLGAFLIWGHY